MNYNECSIAMSNNLTSDKILETLSAKWKNLIKIQLDLELNDDLDIRFLKIKLKELERKKLM